MPHPADVYIISLNLSSNTTLVKPLKRFRVEHGTRDTHLKVGVNEKIMTGRLSILDVVSALSSTSFDHTPI
jgi:hypothetical protein